MKTTQLEVALSGYLDFRRNLIVPNVTYIKSVLEFEVDLLCVTNAGYASGYELKVSRSDLRADFKKSRHKAGGHWNPYRSLKHFYYVVRREDEDIALDLVPEKFGVITFHTYDSHGVNLIGFNHVRKASLLSNYKWTTEQMLALGKLAAMRIPSLKARIIE